MKKETCLRCGGKTKIKTTQSPREIDLLIWYCMSRIFQNLPIHSLNEPYYAFRLRGGNDLRYKWYGCFTSYFNQQVQTTK